MKIAGRTGFERAEGALAGAAFLAPFSATQLVGSLTLGRAALLALAAMLALDAYAEGVRRPPGERSYRLLVGAYACLWLWVLLSSIAWGCNCDGKLGGFTEFVALGVLAVTAISLKPRLRGAVLPSLLAGLLLASLLALLGVGSLNSQTVDLTETGGRLSGTFGNANELGFAAALGIPIALAYRSLGGRPGRLLFGGGIVLLGVTIVLTYSRAAVIAAAVGVVVVLLLESRGSRRRIAAIVGAAVACALAAIVLYNVFETERKEVSFTQVSPALRGLDARDVTGWDSRALGPIPRGPSSPANRDGAIAVPSREGGEGISYRWGEAGTGNLYVLRLRARAPRDPVELRYALGDAGRDPERSGLAPIGRDWTTVTLRWRPKVPAPHATFYAWQEDADATFELAGVTISSPAGGNSDVIALPERLEGSIYDRLTGRADRSERRYIESRLDAAELSLDAFREKPIWGIGWSSFPDYSATHLDYGELAVHDQYLAVLAELGLVGVALFALFVAAIARGAWTVRRGTPETAAIGLLLSAAAGMVFVEALPTPQLSIAIALAAAIVCGQGRRAPT